LRPVGDNVLLCAILSEFLFNVDVCFEKDFISILCFLQNYEAFRRFIRI